MGKVKDKVGMKFGKLLVISLSHVGEHGAVWNCICDCGNPHVARGDRLIYGKTSSCGCGHIGASITHGMSGTDIHQVWLDARQRCRNIKNKNYHNYGGRGIIFDESWDSFEVFYTDMAYGYSKGLELDRIDNNKGYSKDNCRWVTRKQNLRNTRRNRIIEYKGVSYCVEDFCRLSNTNPNTVYGRLNKGYSLDESLSSTIFREKPVINGEGEIFKSARQACKFLGKKYGGGIAACCRGKQRTAHGTTWAYYTPT